jgi:hypothetical protein
MGDNATHLLTKEFNSQKFGVLSYLETPNLKNMEEQWH